MLKTTLLAAATFAALGVGSAHAGAAQIPYGVSQETAHGHAHGGGSGGVYKSAYYGGRYAKPYGAPRHGAHRRGRGWHGKHYRHGYRKPPARFGYRGGPYCHFEPQKVRIKVWDRRGNPYRKWIWKDVKVCA